MRGKKFNQDKAPLLSENQYDGGDDEPAADDAPAIDGDKAEGDAAEKKSMTDSEAMRAAAERQKRMNIIRK